MVEEAFITSGRWRGTDNSLSRCGGADQSQTWGEDPRRQKLLHFDPASQIKRTAGTCDKGRLSTKMMTSLSLSRGALISGK